MGVPMGMMVVGLVTGTHLIEDIRVTVPHNVAVAITADQMLRSKDLYRALNQGHIFKLSGVVGPQQNAPGPSVDAAELAKLRQENKELKRKLSDAEARNVGLQRALQGMNTHLDGVLASLGRLESAQMPAQAQSPGFTLDELVNALEARGVPLVAEGSSPQVASPVSDVVDVDVPMFIPEHVKPEDAQTNIKVQKTVQESASVTSAASKLKELRKAQSGE